MPNEPDIGYSVGIEDIKNLEKQLKNVEKLILKSTDETQKKVSQQESVFSGMIKVEALKAGLKTASDLIKNGLSKIVSETGQLETATIKWETLTGSAEIAGQKIKEIFEFSNRTPFTFKGVEEATQTIYKLSNGILSTTKDIELLGDASAKGGRPIEELAVTWGRLYQKFEQGDTAFADEINRMNELGIITGDTKKELQSMDSQMLQTQGWDTFTKGAESASGMMEKLSSTIEGKLSTLDGKWDGLFAFDDKGVQDSIKGSIDALINALDTNKPIIQEILKDTFGIITDIVTDSMWAISEIWKEANPLKAQILENKKLYEQQTNAMSFQLSNNFSVEELKKRATGFETFEGKDIRESTIQDMIKTYGMKDEGVDTIEELIAQMEVFGENISSKAKEDLKWLKATNKLEIEYRATKQAINKLTTTSSIPTTTSPSTTTTPISKIYGDYSFMSETRKGFDSSLGFQQPSTGMFSNEAFMLDSMLNDEQYQDLSNRIINGQTLSEEVNQGLYKINEDVNSTNEEIISNNIAYYDNVTGIISNSESAIMSIHQIWSSDMLSLQAKGMSSLVNTTSSILKNIGSLTGSQNLQAGSGLLGGLGIIGAGLSLVGGIASLFEDDTEDTEPSSNDIAVSNANAKADIISTAVDTLVINAYTTINSTIVDENSMDRIFNEQFAPRLAEVVQGAF